MRILLCVSDFPYSEPTIKFGAVLVGLLEAEIDLITVRPQDEAPPTGSQILDKAAELLAFPVEQRITQRGTAAKQILEQIESGRYHLVIIGARDKLTLGELLLGSVARTIVSNSPVSVVIVREPTYHLEKLLLCTPGPERSEHLIQAGIRLAKAAQAQVTLLYVTEPYPQMYTGLRRLQENLEELLKRDTPLARHLRDTAALLRSQHIDTQLELRHGYAAEEILTAVEQSEYDLLIIGGPAFRGLSQLLMDQVYMPIVDHSPRPVLVVRGDLPEV
jgi:nucleotide-binding universal stress UspA family protein